MAVEARRCSYYCNARDDHPSGVFPDARPVAYYAYAHQRVVVLNAYRKAPALQLRQVTVNLRNP
jgi:hypothetical protein